MSQVWEVSSGEMLLSVLFDVGIMSVTFDPCEYFLFCGGSDGNIFQVSLCSTVSTLDAGIPWSVAFIPSFYHHCEVVYEMFNWPIAYGEAACCGFISNNAHCLIFTALDGEDYSHFNWTPAWQRLDINTVESFSVKSSFLFFHIVLRVNLVDFNFWCETFICWSLWSSVLILHMSPQHCWELKWVVIFLFFWWAVCFSPGQGIL